MTPPLPVTIESVQYTPRRDGMIIQVSASDATHPQTDLVGQCKLIQTRQRLVAGDDTVNLGDVEWNDASIEGIVAAWFAAMGLTVSILPNYLPGEAPSTETPPSDAGGDAGGDAPPNDPPGAAA